MCCNDEDRFNHYAHKCQPSSVHQFALLMVAGVNLALLVSSVSENVFSLITMIMPRLGWRWPLSLSSIPSFVKLLLFVFTVVSPRCLCAMGRTSDACDISKKIAVVNKTQLPPGKLVSSQLTKELHSPGKKQNLKC
ncbi:hypothetical protein AABB24_036777 [Solanum stoloniferum]|uniref:Uncharacterized protein n=1 Tax=Solanum stoloniferum TaxID=62892 RepID=A0ABD2R1U0_9SOLN